MHNARGFTVVEILISIVVIGLLAAISIFAWNSWQESVHQSVLRSDLTTASAQLDNDLMFNDAYPESETLVDGGRGLPKSDGTTYAYTRIAADRYCLSASSDKPGVAPLHVTNDGSIAEGECPEVAIAHGTAIQTINSANCPTERIRAVDARDNNTYWVQKLADGKCWMLTNLAYAGGGSNTHGDAKAIAQGTGQSYTTPHYYIPAGSNPTTEPASPSTSTTGIGQYGYLYNYCGANGGQSGNGACSSTNGAAVNPSVSICPANWRLPTGGTSGDFVALNNAVNAGRTNTDQGIREVWLGQYGGRWSYAFAAQGSNGYYWSSSHPNVASAHHLSFDSSYVYPAGVVSKVTNYSVRCVAN